MLRSLDLPDGLAVRLGAPGPSPDAGSLERVEVIWQAERTRRGDALFDGGLVSIAGPIGPVMAGWLAPYRWFLAQRRDPTLAAVLEVRPLAVTGILSLAAGVAIGRRAGHLEQDAGLWELVPSGGVDAQAITPGGMVDPGEALLRELAEEIGIDRHALSAPPRAQMLVEDPVSQVIDVAMALALPPPWTAERVIAVQAASAGREHETLRIIPAADLIAGRGPVLAPVSRLILERITPDRAD